MTTPESEKASLNPEKTNRAKAKLMDFLKHPKIREIVEGLRVANTQRLANEKQALLEVDELSIGHVYNLMKSIGDKLAVQYIMDSAAKGTWDWMIKNGWVFMDFNEPSGWRFSDIMSDALNPKTYKIKNDEWPINIVDFNGMMYRLFVSDYPDFPQDFWEISPAVINYAKEMYSTRRIAISGFLLGCANNLWNTVDNNGKYTYRLPSSDILIPEGFIHFSDANRLPSSGSLIPAGFIHFSDAIGDLYYLFNGKGRAWLRSVVLPSESGKYFKQQANLISNPVYPIGLWNKFRFKAYRFYSWLTSR